MWAGTLSWAGESVGPAPQKRESIPEAANAPKPWQGAWPESCLCPEPAGSPSVGPEQLWPVGRTDVPTAPVGLSGHLATALRAALQGGV